jgi:phenylpyruvate tautomerase PptA (4-oxalocrotonate tautomerase family)
MYEKMLDLDKMIENMKKINAGFQQVTFKKKDYSITIIIEEVEDENEND